MPSHEESRMEPHRRGRFRLFGPIPTYSRTTRRGNRVSVGGCCLPLPIGCLTVTLATAVGGVLTTAARRRAVKARRGTWLVR